MEENVLGKSCNGTDIVGIPGREMSVHRNRHPNCDGTDWGWIEGCTKNICWSDKPGSRFKRKDAEELANTWNLKRGIR